MTKHSRGMAALMVLACLLLILPLSGCSISESRITTSADNYVRLTEYRAMHLIYGGIAGCQLSGDGEMKGNWQLKTKNCEASAQ